MVIDELLEVLPVPDSPVETGRGKDWGVVTDLFGAPLPTDYMIFIERYGSGQIGRWLTVFNPFSSNTHLSLRDQFFRILSGLNATKKEFPKSCPFPLLFEPDGLLPWGISIDGDIFFWQTKGVSGLWTIVVIGRHSEPEAHKLSFAQFIARSIKGEILCDVIPTEWREEEITFLPYHLRP
jgi:hypothetical protein